MNTPIHVVAAVIHNQKGEILCARRSKTMTLPGYWEFPGGKVELDETPAIALVREIREELRCEIVVGSFIEETTYRYEAFTIRLQTYFSTVQSGTMFALEHSELKWIAWQDLRLLEWAPADIPAVERVMQLCKKEFMNN
ncbi:(deoxy)nucleoside triphosphate pyrophosphohydrolase [Sporosarcina sp. BI001-red]|uniref:(deoxy)nucleoside triphosphate pyrophosphohydrolase n=1 Tax=Sporosarcina sp. BI001-red TaxID=2282866 RepID=UPI000E288756|nr:(deoxy)nucleoside triphosphate pyrophosphohydrolase [Sporosarcina sp. BI001-red]REB05170.1 (deoxy)nucleoside triphosphate pyrophosphohydrolase [Sporosarcina sp. BI001-red]